MVLCESGSYDLVLVDGLHTFEQSMVDMYYADLLLRRGGFLLLDDVTEAWPAVEAAAAFWNTSRVGFGYDHCTKAQFYYPSPRKRMRCWRKVEDSSFERLWSGAPTSHKAKREVLDDHRPPHSPPPPSMSPPALVGHPRWAAATVGREEKLRSGQHAAGQQQFLSLRKQLKEAALKDDLLTEAKDASKDSATPLAPLHLPSPPLPPSLAQASPPVHPAPPPASAMRSMLNAFFSAPSLADTPVLGT